MSRSSSAPTAVGWKPNLRTGGQRGRYPGELPTPPKSSTGLPTDPNQQEKAMDALRELIEVTDRTLTIRLPDHFQAKRVEVIVLDADDATRVRSGAALTRRRPSPLMAGARIVGDIMSPVVDPDEWGVLK